MQTLSINMVPYVINTWLHELTFCILQGKTMVLQPPENFFKILQVLCVTHSGYENVIQITDYVRNAL